MLVLACVGIYFAVSKLVLHPLDALGRAAKQIGAGDFSYQLEARTVGGPDAVSYTHVDGYKRQAYASPAMPTMRFSGSGSSVHAAATADQNSRWANGSFSCTMLSSSTDGTSPSCCLLYTS